MVLFWPLLIALLGKVGAAAGAVGGAIAKVGGAAKGLLGAGAKAGASAAPAAGAEVAKTAAVTPAIATPPPSAPPPSTGGGGLFGMGGGGKPPPAPGGGLQNLAKQSMVKKGGGAISLPDPGGPAQGPPSGPGGELAKGQIELPDTGGPKNFYREPPGGGPHGPGGHPGFSGNPPMVEPSAASNAFLSKPPPPAAATPPPAGPSWGQMAQNEAYSVFGQSTPGRMMSTFGDMKDAWQNPAYSGGRKAWETAKPLLKFGLEQSMGGVNGGGGPQGPPPGEDEMNDYARQRMMARADTLGSQSPMPDWRRRLEEMQRQRMGGGYGGGHH